MELTLNSRCNAPSGFLVVLRRWARSFRAHRQHRRAIRSISELPDHLLRDIGHEKLITPRCSPGVFGY